MSDAKFTAAHLARLKEKLTHCENSGSGRPLDKVGVILEYPEAKGLVERLERAEAFIKHLQSEEIKDSDLDEDKRLYDAWLASKGEK